MSPQTAFWLPAIGVTLVAVITTAFALVYFDQRHSPSESDESPMNPPDRAGGEPSPSDHGVFVGNTMNGVRLPDCCEQHAREAGLQYYPAHAAYFQAQADQRRRLAAASVSRSNIDVHLTVVQGGKR